MEVRQCRVLLWQIGGLWVAYVDLSFISALSILLPLQICPHPTSGDAEGTSNLYRDPVDFILFQ